MTRNEIDKTLLCLHVRARLDRSVMVIEGTSSDTIALNRYRHHEQLRGMGLTWPPTK
jgi:hypothetical protein